MANENMNLLLGQHVDFDVAFFQAKLLHKAISTILWFHIQRQLFGPWKNVRRIRSSDIWQRYRIHCFSNSRETDLGLSMCALNKRKPINSSAHLSLRLCLSVSWHCIHTLAVCASNRIRSSDRCKQLKNYNTPLMPNFGTQTQNPRMLPAPVWGRLLTLCCHRSLSARVFICVSKNLHVFVIIKSA